jgi:hypothetical protein
MRRLLLASMALAALGVSEASAGTLYYDHYGWFGDNVQINSPNSIYGGAGQIQLYSKSGQLLADAWCLDVSDYLQQPQLMNVVGATALTVETGLPAGGLSQFQLTRIEQYVTQGDNALAHGGSADFSAAIQIAIWKTEYGDGFDYNSINQTVSDDVANLLLEAMPAPGAAPAAGYRGPVFSFLVPIDPVPSQTLITESLAAPEPSTWAMILLGFAGLSYAGYRGRRSSVAAAL